MPQYRSEQHPRIRFSNIYRGCKKYFILHVLVACVIIYLLVALGGGLIPRFLIPRMPFLAIRSDINALMFFDVNNDASRVTWARATNNREAVEKAAKSNVHMIEGDVILQGQGTTHQKLIPVMAQPPQSESDLLLVDWLDRIKLLNKGIKLDFSVIDSLEISLQRLQEFDISFPIHFPVWIHADVLQGPHGGKVKVDPSRFFQTLKRVFPRCTVSLGWTTAPHTDLSQSGYTWDMVLDMYELVRKWRIEDQPVVFQARLSLIRNSVPQLKWLCDNIAHSALNVLHVEGDEVQSEDLMYIAYRFPPDEAFFDLNHEKYETMLTQYRHFSRQKTGFYVGKRDEVIFKPKAWVKMGLYTEEDSVLPSTEALVLTSPYVYVVTKSRYKPTSQIYIQGRVQFLNRKKNLSESFATGLNIYLRSVAYAEFDHIIGIKCFLGVDGDIEVKGSNLPREIPDFRKTARITPTTSHCFRFHITDTGDQLIFKVSTVSNCQKLESVVPELNDTDSPKKELDSSSLKENYQTLTIDLPHRLTHEQSPFILRMEDGMRQAVIDELSVKHMM
ncbi:menorin-like [Babylonia areolata]|uniref:menorin-like n=1 Tax=Babylonia areolata TaxID=304850 RepID=UPI003FD24C2D